MRDRMLPIVAGVSLAAVAGALVLGVPAVSTSNGWPMLVLAPLAALVFFVGRRRSVIVEGPWFAPTAAASPAGLRPARQPATSTAVARTLGRVEAREMATSLAFGVGVGFCILVFLLFGVLWAPENGDTWNEYIQIAPWFVHPLVGLAVLASHRAVTRARRDDTEELFATCPTGPTTRTVGFLLMSVVPVLTLFVFLAALFAASSVRSPRLHGSPVADNLADVLGAALLGAGGVALGVALGRWVRFSLVPVVVVVGIGLLTPRINSVGDPGWNPFVQLTTAPAIFDPSPIFLDRAAWWHVLWISGLTTAVALVAVARHRRDSTVAVIGVAVASTLLLAGYGATRPMSAGTADRIADRIAQPAVHQDCASAGGHVRVCTYRGLAELRDRVVKRVQPVGDHLPEAVPLLTLRQSFDGKLENLPSEVRRRLPDGVPGQMTGEARLGSSATDGEIDAAAFDISFTALGLATEPDSHLMPMVVAGQARGVVALWLATRGLPPGVARALATSAAPASPDAFERGALEVGVCSVPSVVWSAQDLAAARALMALPDAQVRRVVTDGWPRWSDPQTGTDDLMSAAGLPAVGPFDQIQARPGQPC